MLLANKILTYKIMHIVKLSFLTPLFLYYLLLPFCAQADMLEVVANIESGRVIDGVNLTDNQLNAGLTTEWSADNGVFASLSCFVGEKRSQRAIQRGCDGSMGWFTPINDTHAVSLAVSRHDYSSPILRGWQYTAASVNWHMGSHHTLKIRATDSLLGQRFSATTASYHVSKPLNDKWSLNFEGGVTSLSGSDSISTLEYGILSTDYTRGRWNTQLVLILSSSNYKRLVGLDIDQPDVSINFRYQLY